MTGAAEPETGETTETSATTTSTIGTADIDWKSKAREWERRAKENSSAAARLAELEESQKSETQKLADAKAAAERAADEARADALRWRTAAKHGISDEDAELFLTGTDEATLTKQAERLADRVADRKKNGNHVPREGATQAQPGADPVRDFARQLFGATDS